VDGVLEVTDTIEPWGFDWDVSALKPGSDHTVYIRAYDAAQNIGTAGPFNYIIDTP
jgi:hypothetical protein